jgi:hypothetical protein
MNFNNAIRGNYCRYGCRTPIKFDDNQVSARGLKIPLNINGTPHDCAYRPYNRRRQMLVKIPNSGSRWDVKPCKYCFQPITFDDCVRSPSGKRIPLNADGSHHERPSNPYNVSRRSQ